VEKSESGEGQRLSSQERIMVIVEKLVENQIFGMTNKNLASELGTTEANICRDMKNMELHGWVAKLNGKWRLTPKFGGFAGQIIKGFQAAKLRLTEDEARYASAVQ
jgi:DNA-binding IclR family transcriptional regulator